MGYDSMRVIDLKTLAKECGLRGYSKLRKDELITLLRNNQPAPALQTSASSSNLGAKKTSRFYCSDLLLHHL